MLIRDASPAQLLAALPSLVGRDPRESVVLLAFRGRRTHAALRFDIPRTGFGRFAATAVGTFCRIPDADDVVPVIWSEGPHDELAGILVTRFRQAGFAVRDALSITVDGWYSHLDPDQRMHPLSEIEDAAGRLALDPPPEVLARVPRADDVACRRMATELARLRLLIDSADPEDFEELEPLADLPFLAENALAWTPAELAERGPLLLVALQGPPARDLVMLQWAFGLELGDAMWSGDTCVGIEARKVYSDVKNYSAELMLGRGPAPDRERVEAAMALLTTLISLAGDAERRAPLCMLAWLNWALGRGSVAGAHIDEVRAIDPAYGMGELLDTLFGTGAMPEWLFHRS